MNEVIQNNNSKNIIIYSLIAVVGILLGYLLSNYFLKDSDSKCNNNNECEECKECEKVTQRYAYEVIKYNNQHILILYNDNTLQYIYGGMSLETPMSFDGTYTTDTDYNLTLTINENITCKTTLTSTANLVDTCSGLKTAVNNRLSGE